MPNLFEFKPFLFVLVAPQTSLITLQDVSVRKYDTVVIQHLTWTLEPDQHWAIIGDNGSGKTTFMEALAGKIPFLEGTAQYSLIEPGHSIREYIDLAFTSYNQNRILQGSAKYYQQRFHAYDSENSPTVRQFLTGQMMPVGTIDASSVELPPPLYSEEQLQETATLLKINHLLDRQVITLSNGETRRTFLTRSLLKKPKVLLLDMPFIGLDVQSRAIFQEVITHIAANGTTLIIATTPDEIPACITHTLNLSPKTHIALPSIVRPAQAPESTQADTFTYAVRMRNVKVTYQEKNVLDNITWDVKRGERWAIAGPNGSGKSTLLSLIYADNPQSYANDFDLFDRKRGTGESIWDIKARIGFVSPELHLYFTRRTEVYKAVASGLFHTNGLYQLLKPAQRKQAEYYLTLLGIADLSEKKFIDLSTGEQRLVLLARALVRNPPLLILDEPCQGLDSHRMIYFRELVNELCIRLHKTLLYVTHYEHEIPACVTKILRLDQGKARIEERK